MPIPMDLIPTEDHGHHLPKWGGSRTDFYSTPQPPRRSRAKM